ncbi:acetyl-CoA synthetase-like protein [Daldinia caldariorum]|uniref:acetyl-CoA synthetase-like protein n=1 Tax=Daldinia caldariorum TaxID=326644 RepID=UPI002007DC86|nr:acetyl-CoA synthetase-like protein [Daldinia caldariorum]KAI1468206.1 acetyl-CoA synthetase-like protein [Daldinia caldariorum]
MESMAREMLPPSGLEVRKAEILDISDSELNADKLNDRNELTLIIVRAISTVLGVSVDEIHSTADTTTFIKLGGNSLSAILICAECQRKGILIPAGVFLRISTVNEVITTAAGLAERIPTPIPTIIVTEDTSDNTEGDISSDDASSIHTTITTPDPETEDSSQLRHGKNIVTVESLLSKIDPDEWTEPQLLLLRETSQNQKLNILTIHESYAGDWDAQVLWDAWASTILAEPIFKDLLRDLDVLPQQFLLRKIVQVESEDGFRREIRSAVNAVGPITKLTVVQFSTSSESNSTSKTTTVIWRVHHAFMDGYSARILRDKIARTLRGGEFGITAGPSFKETVRSLQALREEKSESTRRFWDGKREKFPAAIGELRLSPQRVVKAAEVSPQKSLTIEFPSEQLAAAVARTGYTATVFLAAAWALTLGKLMDADQVCFGMVFSGRDLPIPGAFDVVGPLINILPLFLHVPEEDDEISVEGFLRRIHADILDLNNVQHSDSTEGFDRKFHSIMATQFECDEEKSPSPIPVDRKRPDMRSGIPLNIIIEDECRLQMFYSTAHFADEDMNNLRSVFQNSMNCLLQNENEKQLVWRMNDALLPYEMEQTIRAWSNCASPETLDESKGDDLVTLFENVVARQPNEFAVIHGEVKVSYGKLDQASGVIARKLSWIEPNEAVCVYADRSVNWLVAIFGVLKAGGVYAPLDPSAPVSVRRANFIRSGARAVLVPSRASSQQVVSSRQEEEEEDATPFQSLVLAVDELLATNDTQARDSFSAYYPRRRIARPDDLAYICFTSGSTGQPKAVQCTHKGLVAFQKDRAVRLGASKGVVIAQIMSPVFDGSIHEIFSALTHGATLRLASPNHQGDPFSHLRDSDAAILTPSIAKALDPNQYPRLKHVYLVGEAVPQSLCESWARDRSLYNMYGPTEATCGATIKQLFPNQAVSLGRPNPSSRVYILDHNLRLLPPGAVGELYIAGIQVSRGYIKLPEQNASRFLEDSVMPETGQKMYRTGDYAYWNSTTGEICILGRKDRQIKLNGFRLDLDDLEARVVKAIPGCRGAAIFRRDDHLVAAYQTTSRDAVNAIDVKAYISNALPPYAMPRRIVAFDEFPLTAAGKLDYKAIEKFINASIADTKIVPQHQKRAMSATEKKVADVVRDLMRLDPSVSVDQDSNLTELGCHSILQLQLASRISSLIQRQFPVRKVIENLVVSRLASAIDDSSGEETQLDANISRQPLNLVYDSMKTLGDHGVSPIERDWFLKYQKNLGTSSFNVSHVSEFDAFFDQHQALVSAWNTVLARHEILRCRFRLSENGSVERSYAVEPPKVLYTEDFDVRAEINKEFSLETENPIRVLVSKDRMLVCVSHIICDYTTLDCLFEELTSMYLNIDKEESPLVTQKRYQETTCWNLEVDQATVDFWKSYLSGVDFTGISPYMRASRTSYYGESFLFRLSKNAMPSLQTVSRSMRLTLHQIALAVVSLVLQIDSPTKQDLVLGSPYLGRQEDDMRTVGLFLQPIPIRIRRQSDQHDDDDFKEAPLTTFLQAVQQSSRSALGHAVEWSSLMKILSSSDDENLRAAAATAIPNNPLFDAMVTFHEPSTTGKSSSSAIPGIQPLVNWANGAKFGIMFEFSAISSSTVTLRVEYDTANFSSDEVRLFVARIDAGFRYLCENPTSGTLGELEGKLSGVGFEGFSDGDGSTSTGIEVVEFGTPIAALA